MCLQGFGYIEPLVGFVLLICLSFACHSLHGFSIPCNNVSLRESCPASVYYVPSTSKSLEETAALFSVNSNAVNRTINGFSIAINCSCLPGHNEFTRHVDNEVQSGDTWESVSSKFGSFVVEKTEKTVIAFLVVTLDLLCGCSKSGDVVTYRVRQGDTLYIICSQFNADINRAIKLNQITNPNLIHDGDAIFIPEPALQNLTLLDNKDSNIKKSSKSKTHILIGATIAAGGVILLIVIFVSWNYYKRKGIQQSRHYSRRTGDFGLVKLLEHSPDVGAATSQIVGTFGYLAPEYVLDGVVTAKSDVYAFGVVLMELLTGQPALSRDASPGNNQYSEHRSLVNYMILALNDTDNPMAELTKCIDPNLTHYH